MFEPFFTTKEVGKGSGMGLAMVHGIVHNHGGHLLVDSVLGEGTAVRVLLSPVDAADAAGQIERRPSRIVTARQPLQGRVLVAEDEDAIRELLYELLTGWGLEVAVSTTGMEAMAAFAQDPGRFDLLITDQTMPGMTGLALARQVTQLRADIPVVLCTGFAEDLQKEELAAAGIHKLARKPFEPVELHAILRDVLATVRG
jgi:CheY-like chemotaxis protein